MAAGSPLQAHGASPVELKQRLEADAAGDPYLLYRDGSGTQRMVSLGETRDRLTVGRTEAADVVLGWDGEVSRVHAALERLADGWVLVDDGLSLNGSYLNHERVQGRRLLADGDLLRFGDTLVAFRDPALQRVDATVPSREQMGTARLTESQKRVLVALCRPYAEGRPFPAPATNQQIAEELVLSVEAVKSQLRLLFASFDLDRLPRQEKRVRLVESAFQSGAVSARDFERGT